MLPLAGWATAFFWRRKPKYHQSLSLTTGPPTLALKFL
jgi:hypothetical protein